MSFPHGLLKRATNKTRPTQGPPSTFNPIVPRIRTGPGNDLDATRDLVHDALDDGHVLLMGEGWALAGSAHL